LARAHRQQRLRAIQGLNLRFLIGAQDERAVRRIQVETHDIPDFLHEQGSFESLKASVRCGCRPKARQIRLTVLWLNPQRAAMARVLQWVAARGFASSVSVTTCSTWASLMRRGAPGRGSSSKPSRRAVRNRLRHLPTVCLVSRNSRATRVFVRPLAHVKTTRARWASACAVVGRRAQRSKVSRSSSVSVSTGMDDRWP